MDLLHRKAQSYKFSNKNGLFCAWRDFNKTFCAISTYHKWMFKLQISSMFNFDRAHQSWISGVLGVKHWHGKTNYFQTWVSFLILQKLKKHLVIWVTNLKNFQYNMLENNKKDNLMTVWHLCAWQLFDYLLTTRFLPHNFLMTAR